jgi:hypothetical protein
MSPQGADLSLHPLPFHIVEHLFPPYSAVPELGTGQQSAYLVEINTIPLFHYVENAHSFIPRLWNLRNVSFHAFRLFRTSRWRPQKVDKRMVLEYTHGLFIT